MRIIIYNPNSIGGNYAYAVELFKAYRASDKVEMAVLILPANVDKDIAGSEKILLPDISPHDNFLFRKLYFVYRSLANPFRFYKWLRRQPPSVVVFNDYDQLTSLMWVPFFRREKKRHKFAVILHDPDRDKYFRSKVLSVVTMKAVMRLMDVGFYHGFLPDKPYYEKLPARLAVPHGIFPAEQNDMILATQISDFARGRYVMGILGNIREEKNYEQVIPLLAAMPDAVLLVAGTKANQSVNTDRYRTLIQKSGVEDQVLWIEKYLTDAEMAAAIDCCDVVLLYYKPTFTSQSGILNKVAPYRKNVIVADAPSSLRQVVDNYQLGKIVPAENASALLSSIQVMRQENFNANKGWERYIAETGWDLHVDQVSHFLKSIA